MKVILASTSSLFGEGYLAYLTETIKKLYTGVNEIVFIPFARPSGISHDDYTQRAATFFNTIGIQVIGLHTFKDPVEAIKNAKGVFTGGGNTFLLVKTLHELHLMNEMANVVKNGTPYLGTSAGSNIGGLNMQTTNDMPIVYPPSFKTMGLVPFNINPHYLDHQAGLKHNGETRETRILEFLSQNDIPVVGLREGNWVKIEGNTITVEGQNTTRIFEKNKPPYELEAGNILHFTETM